MKKDEKGAGTAVAVQETANGASAVQAYDYGQDAGKGFENQTREDYAIPFLGVIQSLSPQMTSLPNCKPGLLLNTVTNDLFDGQKGIDFVPAHTEHCFVRWIPRTRGGGFVSRHELDSAIVKECREKQPFGEYRIKTGTGDVEILADEKDKEADDLIETFYVYGTAVLPDGTEQEMVLAFSSTKIKPYKGWMVKARSVMITLPNGSRINPPLFAHKYHLSTVEQSNKANQKFFNFNAITFSGADAEKSRLAPDDPLYLRARGIRDLVIAGKAKAAYETQAPQDAAGAGAGDAAPY